MMFAAFLAMAFVMIDGDTFRLSAGETIRLANIDAPEICRAACDDELLRGVKARLRLRELLSAGPMTIERRGKDRNGRTLALVFVGGRDVGAVLVAEGHAVVWERRRHKWCP